MRSLLLLGDFSSSHRVSFMFTKYKLPEKCKLHFERQVSIYGENYVLVVGCSKLSNCTVKQSTD